MSRPVSPSLDTVVFNPSHQAQMHALIQHLQQLIAHGSNPSLVPHPGPAQRVIDAFNPANMPVAPPQPPGGPVPIPTPQLAGRRALGLGY